ncbi:MAG: hypothetical protein KC483_07435 [Nitrosarchaeum sp.]|nr:hypothetical protein [Nitrosarchaeum sp.]MCA9819494.1 hypothetical protein [Nitrosarchaeum sp.]
MSDKKIHQLNVRLNHKNFVILEQISKDINQSPSTLGSQIISQWIEFYYYKIHRGDIIFSRQIVRKIISILDKSKIDEVSKFMAKHIINEIRLQEGEVTYAVLAEHILKWNKGNRLHLNKIRHSDDHDDESLDVFISKHNLGCNWSELECKTYTKTFEMVKQNVFSSEYDEDMFCIKVINRNVLQ